MTPKKTTGVYAYATDQGQRWRIKVERDGRTVNRRGFATKKEAETERAKVLTELEAQTYVAPSKLRFGDYLATWLDGLQHKPSTMASYRKNCRLHITPHLGTVQLANLTPDKLAGLYRKLETSGRKDGQGGGLSARTVRYVHTIISAALQDAVEAGQLARNPARSKAAKPPSAKKAAAPEMHPWTAAGLGAFLAWSSKASGRSAELHAAWHVLAYTGMRRGELLALRWQDCDLAAGTLTVRRSSTLVRNKGEGATVETGTTKTDKPRVVDLDPGTVAVLKAHKAARGTLHLQLAQPGALVFGDREGDERQPEHFSRSFSQALARCGRDLGEAAPPAIRLHD